MINANPLLGTGLHALGGVSASACYLPNNRTKKWSWGTFWIVQAMFAWLIMPILIGYFTVPDFFTILKEAPRDSITAAFLFGALYGFGGMSFGLAIKHIGYSLTYTIAIGISAVLGTIVPLIIFGGIVEYFTMPGGNIVLAGMIISVSGVALCGLAGFKKEKDLSSLQGNNIKFNMLTGLLLAIVAGILSGIFNVSLEYGKPIADMAAAHGAGHFESNAKMIVSTSGCLIVNLIWFLIAGIREKTLHEFTRASGLTNGQLARNYIWSAFAGSLWFMQFFFYGLGHVRMGKFSFASWVIHMSMLIFFSYIVGVFMKEWRNIKKTTYITFVIALLTLVLSFAITTYGSVYGQKVLQGTVVKEKFQ